jgi:acyl-coenzyme A synthetase/AMP-(fatty) acid ligase
VREVFGATECGSIASRRTTAGPEWAAYPGVSIDFDEDGAVVTAAQMAPVRLADVLERAAGGFRLLGRRTDLVKLGGRRASLTGLNQVLLGIDGVEDGAFVVPDDLDARSTARLVAVVVAPGRSGASILAALRGLVDPVFLPRRVVHVERLPRNELGKLPRLALLDVVTQAGAA